MYTQRDIVLCVAAAGDNKPTLWTIATALKYSMSSSTKTGSAAPRYLKDRPELLLATLKVSAVSAHALLHWKKGTQLLTFLCVVCDRTPSRSTWTLRP